MYILFLATFHHILRMRCATLFGTSKKETNKKVWLSLIGTNGFMAVIHLSDPARIRSSK